MATAQLEELGFSEGLRLWLGSNLVSAPGGGGLTWTFDLDGEETPSNNNHRVDSLAAHHRQDVMSMLGGSIPTPQSSPMWAWRHCVRMQAGVPAVGVTAGASPPVSPQAQTCQPCWSETGGPPPRSPTGLHTCPSQGYRPQYGATKVAVVLQARGNCTRITRPPSTGICWGTCHQG